MSKELEPHVEVHQHSAEHGEFLLGALSANIDTLGRRMEKIEDTLAASHKEIMDFITAHLKEESLLWDKNGAEHKEIAMWQSKVIGIAIACTTMGGVIGFAVHILITWGRAGG
jgi:hypothetical protein